MTSRVFTAVAVALVAAVVTRSASAQTPVAGPAPAPRTIPELEQRLRDVLARTGTPGLSMAIVRHDTVVYAGGLGFADVATRAPATAKTLFRIGSTSKAFTSLAVLMLQEEGKLRLDDPLATHIPEIALENPWESTTPVRIVNALEHTTGFDDWSLGEYAANDSSQTSVRHGLDYRKPGSRVSRWRPGTRVAYSNNGPPLAAYVVEKLEGKPFERVIDERLFRPLGMRTATYFFPDTTAAPIATLYGNNGQPLEYWHALMRPAGAVNASAEDMAQYVRFLLNRGSLHGTRLLAVASIERLERSESSLDARAGLAVGYGLHMARYVDSGFVWTGHDGGVPGGLTNLAYIPELGVGFAFMINQGNRAALTEISRLVRAYLTRDVAAPAPPPATRMTPVIRANAAGWYRADNPRAQQMYAVERITGLTRVSVDGSTLVVRPLLGPARRYVAVTGTTFRQANEPVATLGFVDDTPNGRGLAIERMGYMLPVSLARVSTPIVLLELTIAGLWFVGVAVTLLAAVIGLGRLIRHRRVSPRVDTGWRVPIAASLSLAAAVVIVITTFATNPMALGRPGPASLSSYLLLWMFAALAVAGAVAAIRHVNVHGSTAVQSVSLWASRSVAALNLIVAGYLMYWGAIGWRIWA
jgi:CubicO group peptidase (beta-lactamase class C family)